MFIKSTQFLPKQLGDVKMQFSDQLIMKLYYIVTISGGNQDKLILI